MGSLYLFNKVALGYKDMTPEVHLPMCNFLQTPYIRKMLLHPRLTLKTTVATIGDSIFNAVHDHNVGILIISDTGLNAENFGAEIDAHFRYNQLFRWLFPEIIPENFNTTKWNTSEMIVPRDKVWRTATFTCMGARGHVESHHFDIIKPDDLVTETHIHSDTEMDRLSKWVNGLESLLVDVDTSRIEFVGSIKKKGDTYQKQMAYYAGDAPERPIGPFAVKKGDIAIYRREALEQGESIYPKKISTKFLVRLRRNDPERYHAQFANNPKGTALNPFDINWVGRFSMDPEGFIQVWKDGELTFADSIFNMERVVLYDPAKAEKKTSSMNAILTLAKPQNLPWRFVIEAKIGRYQPDEAVEYLYDLNERFRPSFFSIEHRGYQGSIKYWLNDRAELLNIPYLPVLEWPPEGSSKAQWAKEERIRGMQPMIRSGFLYVRDDGGDDTHVLLDQIEFYPNVDSDDGLDALEQQLDYWPMMENEVRRQERKDAEDRWLQAVLGRKPVVEEFDERKFIQSFDSGGYSFNN